MKKYLLPKAACIVAAGFVLVFFAVCIPNNVQSGIVGGGYIGSEKCDECHKSQYKAWTEHSRKGRSWKTISAMKGGLTTVEFEACFECHTTGYGKETGFVSVEKTPGLKNVGCEACHGPGNLHTQTMEKAHIVKTATIDICQKCHEQEDENGMPKVKSFRYKKVIYAGAH